MKLPAASSGVSKSQPHKTNLAASCGELTPKEIRPEEFIAWNREVARFVEKYKGWIMGACEVNPMFIEESFMEIEYCHDQLGFVWVGELCNYMVPYSYTFKEFELLVDQIFKLNLEYAVKNIGPDRILFGSDFSINDPGSDIASIKNSFLTDHQKQKILSGNLLELINKMSVT